MSDKNDYGFDLDSILAEFSSDGGAQDTEPPKPVRPAKPAKPVKAPAPIPDPAPRTAQPVRRAVEPARPAAPAPSPVRTEPKKRTQENLIQSFSGTDLKQKSHSAHRSPPCAVRR